MTELVGLIIGLAIFLGPLVALSALHNVRDRRELAVCTTVLKQVVTRETRGRIAVQVRCPVFSRWGVVTVDMWACSQEEIWEAMTRLARALPPRVRLVVHGAVNQEIPVRFTVEIRGGGPVYQLSRASLGAL